MPRPSTGDYPANWNEIAQAVKDDAGWRCARCHHHHDVAEGYMLTVHHIDLNKSNCEWWNLAALCQRCHLQIQHKVIIERMYMFEHSEWFKPYAAGYYAHHHNLPDHKEFVVKNMEWLLDFGRPNRRADIVMDFSEIQ
jgi:hypothetical protein